MKELVHLATRLKNPFTDIAVGSATIVWRTTRNESAGQVTDIWTAPITGGEATLRASTPSGGPVDDPELLTSSSALVSTDSFEGLSVAGDNIYWSTTNAGLWRLPLTGDTPPAPVPETAGYHLLSYPWIGKPDLFGRPKREAPAPVFGKLLNVETGETRTAAVPPDTQSWTCGLTRCMGPLPGDKDGITQSRDGSAQRSLPSMDTASATIAQDRFSVLRMHGKDRKALAVVLVDLQTGETGLVGHRDTPTGLARHTLTHHSDLYSYSLNNKLIVIDLRAIH
ncbi:hypothetical protein Aph01nite_15970 [Acrocarpospora phusangensis]|uniref:Lipoprotein LpqB beta-propeller domain-containing protein n=1 Tax=Acrocarpospora phusangensis TaxID=1070424 RepID=A0A919Q6N0_9ACTN|nr:hypothetical protein Aph01nite_15970 [Acrocarpospora phusangensis]